jgi:putative FmdB family regulatory protein
MPIFEYICANCGAKFEKLVLSPSRARRICCPQCKSESVDKAISLFGTSSAAASGGSASACAPSG